MHTEHKIAHDLWILLSESEGSTERSVIARKKTWSLLARRACSARVFPRFFGAIFLKSSANFLKVSSELRRFFFVKLLLLWFKHSDCSVNVFKKFKCLCRMMGDSYSDKRCVARSRRTLSLLHGVYAGLIACLVPLVICDLGKYNFNFLWQINTK